MDRSLQFLHDYPAVAGIGFFLVVSLFLFIVFGVAMRRAGASMRPLLFFFGFLAIVGGPQAAVHLLNAWLAAKATPTVAKIDSVASGQPAPAAAVSSLQPIPWEVVFGPNADPDLITDAKRSLEAVLSTADEAKLSFTASGETALAARFATVAEAKAALDAYGEFFRFANVSGSDAIGWTAQRYAGQGEWNHVVTASNELYAWTGATRESVIAHRVRALGPFDDIALSTPPDPVLAAGPTSTYAEPAADWLRQRPLLMMSFIAINLLLAVAWFFKGSAWATRIAPRADARPADVLTLRERLMALNSQPEPVSVSAGRDGRSIEIDWRYGDAQWFDQMRAHGMHRTHRLVLALDDAGNTVRVREYWSSFDASAGADGLRLEWNAATGMQFFNVEHQRVFGVQLDNRGRPTGELSKAYTFNLQSLRQPVIDVVTGSGWTWQPVMWNAPAAMRWLCE